MFIIAFLSVMGNTILIKNIIPICSLNIIRTELLISRLTIAAVLTGRVISNYSFFK